MGTVGSEARQDASSFLTRAGFVGEDELARLRRSAAERGTTVMEEAALSGDVDEDELADRLSADLGLRRAPADELANLPASIVEAVPSELCVEHRLVPVSTSGRRIEVATGDPCDTGALDEVAFFTEAEIAPAVATQSQIAWCLANYYGVLTPLGERLIERRKKSAARTAEREATSGAPAPSGASEDELKPRAGEISVGPGTGPIPRGERDDLPAVVVDESIAPLGAETAAPAPSQAGETSDVVDLTATKRRPRTQTEIGVPPAGGTNRLADDRAELEDEITTEPGRYPSGTASEAESSRDSVGDPLGDPDVHPYAPRAAEGGSVFAPSAGDDTAPNPAPAAEAADEGARSAQPPATRGAGKGAAPAGSARKRGGTPAEPSAGREHDLPAAPDSEAPEEGEDEAVGPPGTTIPPPFLGATPQSYEELDSGAIPLPIDDPDGDHSAPFAPEGDDRAPPEADALPNALGDRAPASETSGASVFPAAASGAAADPRAAAPGGGEWEREGSASAAASRDLVDALRALDASGSRDEVIETLIGYVGTRYERTAFFAIRARALVLWTARGTRRRPAQGEMLASVPALAESARALRPARGRPGADDLAFLEAWLGDAPDEILALPIAVRERAVGVIYADTRVAPIFDAHLLPLSLAAGDAFARLLRSRKRGITGG